MLAITLSKRISVKNSPYKKIIINPWTDSRTVKSVSHQGEIFSRDGKIANISVVEFKDLHALRKHGQNLFINNSENNIERNNIKTLVRQNFIEGSNVNAIQEMSELIKAHRHFENIQKASLLINTL